MNTSPLRVSVIPFCNNGFEKNALFEGRRLDKSAHSVNLHWQDCFVALYRRALQLNIALFTSDLLAPENADVAIYLRPLKEPREVVVLKQRKPHLKAILVNWETSLGAKYQFNPLNHPGVDAVMTYDRSSLRKNGYLYPGRGVYNLSRIATGLPYAQRRMGCLIGMHRTIRLRSGLGVRKAGWRFSIADWVDYAFNPGQLLNYRYNVAKACAAVPSGSFDLFGEGWDSDPATARICRGIPKESTLSYLGNYRFDLAFENQAGESTLISERIWDALWGDCVPVYNGSKAINQRVPQECFIDAREFHTPEHMLKWLSRCDEKTWNKYREAGREFIRSPMCAKLSPEAVADTFIKPILDLTSGKPRDVGGN